MAEKVIIQRMSNDPTFRKMRKVAEMLEKSSPNNVKYHVGDTYFDFGQDWRWTTIIAERSSSDSWQIFSPNDVRILMETPDTDEGLNTFVENLKQKRFWLDK